jgi:hypothetical protein
MTGSVVNPEMHSSFPKDVGKPVAAVITVEASPGTLFDPLDPATSPVE